MKWIRNNIGIFLIFVVIINGIFMFSYLKTSKKNELVIVDLLGDKEIKLNYNDNYEEQLFEVKVNGKNIPIKDIKYTIDDNINNKLIGNYEVNYKIVYNDKSYYLTRKVNVVDTEAPLIEYDGDLVKISRCKDKIDNLVYKAIDNYDGDITDKVLTEINENEVILTVKDSSGNESKKILGIEYVDEGATKIALNGTNKVYIKKGETFSDPGAYIVDACGKKSTDNLTISGSVNTDTAGTYTITYSYKDISVKREVIVFESANEIINEHSNGKVIYLTFDDGPGSHTERLLDILDKYNVKATFFVTNQFKDYTHLIGEEARRGHVVAVHTLTHKWTIYRSIESYMSDFNAMNEIIKNYTGEYANIFRFPGGSSNKVSISQSRGIMSALAAKMQQDGYQYFDWNVDSRDAENKSSAQIKQNVISGVSRHDYSVVLMHDIKKNTVDVIEDIIIYGLTNGYTFETLNINSPTVHHGINN